jgi:transposase
MKQEEKVEENAVKRRCARSGTTLEIHRLGPHPLIRHFLDRLGVVRILDKHIHSNRTGSLTHGEAIGILVHNVLVSRDPLYGLSSWVGQIDPGALGLTPEQAAAVNDDRMARALDQLSEYAGRGVFFQLALRSIKLFELETARIHFDTTSVTFSGQYRGSTQEPRLLKGHNKDGRPDLKQLVFGLNVTADGAVPLYHQVYSGNRTDDTVHRDNVDALRDLLAKDDFIYTADGKLCTKENLQHIDQFGGKFVTVLPRTRKEDAGFREKLRYRAGRWRTILTVENPRARGEIETYGICTTGPARTEDGFRLIWLRSSAKARHDEEARREELEKAKAALKDLAGKLNQRKLKTRKQIKAAVKRILKDTHCVEFLGVAVVPTVITTYKRTRIGRPKPGDPKERVSTTQYSLEVKEDAVRLRQERNADGVFALVTNLPPKWKAGQVLQIYRYQPYLERRFENLKTEYCVAPVYLKTPKRIVGFLHVCFLALMVAALIEREVRRRMDAEGVEAIPIYPEERECRSPTAPRIFELFSQVDWYKHVGQDEEVLYPVRLSATQRQVLQLLGVPRQQYEGATEA